MYVNNHKMYFDSHKPLAWGNTPNQGPALKYRYYLVMHYTGTERFQSSIDWFGRSKAQASAHLLIGRAGEICQFVSFNQQAWHAGISQWQKHTGLNAYSIGIELSNAGLLFRSAGKYVNAWGRVIPASQVAQDEKGRFWQTYTDKQLEMAVWVAQALHKTYMFKDVVGHEQISPGRKIDPGPLFPMAGFEGKVLGRR